MTQLLCATYQCRPPGRHSTTCKAQPGKPCRGCLPALAATGSLLCKYHIKRLATDPVEAADLWAELAFRLAGGGGGTSEIRTSNPQPGIHINDAAAEVRMWIREDLVYLTRYIAEHRHISLPWKDGPWETITRPVFHCVPYTRQIRRRRRTVDHNTSALGAFVAHHAEWLAGSTIAPEYSSRLQDLVSRARGLRQASDLRIVKIGPCPQTTTGGRRCSGTLRGLLRSSASLLPSAVTCDADENHSWASTQWMKLGRAIKERTMQIEPTDAQVEAALHAMVRLEWMLPYGTTQMNFTEEEIAAGKLLEADADAERQNLAEIREILTAALNPDSEQGRTRD